VVKEQGRVDTDADWNEGLAELSRRIQAGTLDIVGRAVYPMTTPLAFQISADSSSGANKIRIGLGRMYVDGLLGENHGHPSKAQWDPALAELSNTPQPPPSTPPSSWDDTNSIDYANQPYNLTAAKDTWSAGSYLAYLDVWRRPISFIEDSNLVDPAIGVDTSGRVQTAWQVKLMPQPSGSSWSCSTPDADIPWPTSAGRLIFSTVPTPPSGPCCLTTGSGYTGAENQLYRLEIHNGGETGATFKWSRENASVQTNVTAINQGSNSEGNPASVLTVVSLGRDQVLGFSPGDWIEIANQTSDGQVQSGELCQIDSVQVATSTITLTTTLSGDWATALANNSYTRVCRWDQSGKVYKNDNTTVFYDIDASGGTNGIPVPTDGTVLILENGLTVQFSLDPTSGGFLPLDFWMFAARTADPTAHWTQPQPPAGLHHHYTKLAIVTFGSGGATATDCRTPWPPTGGQGQCCDCCCSVTVGAKGQYGSITLALGALSSTGGEICLLPGVIYENVVLNGLKNIVIRGCGRQTTVASAALQSGSGAGGGTPASSFGQAVFTLQGCENIELTSFGVEAAQDEFGVLLDAPQSGTAFRGQQKQGPNRAIVIEDLELIASTRSAVAAVEVGGFKMCSNRVAMEDKPSMYAAVYLSGADILFAHNSVGLSSASVLSPPPPPPPPTTQSVPGAGNTFQVESMIVGTSKTTPEQVNVTASGAIAFEKVSARGGVQVGGPSRNVCIVENQITGGGSNGVTLGDVKELDSTGLNYVTNIWVQWQVDDPCSNTGGGGIPGQGGPGTPQTFVAGGLIENVRIDRNCISNMGMCGIGPIGFFDMRTTKEVISLANIDIGDNVIFRTLKRTMATDFGYGAVSLPDVVNLTIRDNYIFDFGMTPGAEVCGVYVLHGEGIEISRNQIRETRDDTGAALLEPQARYGGRRAGIFIELCAPPQVESSTLSRATFSNETAVNPIYVRQNIRMYETGLPALRIHENVVRTAFGLALSAIGWGPFSILNNSFGTGGQVALETAGPNTAAGIAQASGNTATGFAAPGIASAGWAPALTAGVLNFGVALELLSLDVTLLSRSSKGSDLVSLFPSGAIMFANNMCRYEGRANGANGLCSVGLVSLDHVQFGHNHLWFDSGQTWTFSGNTLTPGAAFVDAWILAGSVQAVGNRLQEAALYPVLYSGFSFGLENITAHNIATYCIAIDGPKKVDSPNIIADTTLCPNEAKLAARSQTLPAGGA
jgi:hypothetical protein